jgi:AICAR transformylase/IMP cyclohydrolase PurH
MNAETQAVKSQDTAPEIKEQAETPVNEETTETKTFTQQELEKQIHARLERERAKYDKKYSGVDVDHYQKLIEKEEKARQADLEKRGEFEALLKEQAEKFSSKIQQYQSELHSIKVDGALLSEASNLKAVNPTQVTQLLKGQLKLSEAGTVDVIDTKTGQVRYNESGDPLQVKDLVSEFLQVNPHFVSAGPSGSGTGQGIGKQKNLVETDITKLDLTKPEQRAQYKELMQARGIKI